MPVKNPFAPRAAPPRTGAIIPLLKGLGCDSLEPNSKLKSRGFMSGFFSKFATLVLAASVCAPGFVSDAHAQKGAVGKRPKKQLKKEAPTPALPAYTPSPLEPLPLDQTPTVAPQVSYKGGELSIIAHNSTLADVLREVRKLTGAEMEVPPNATERVVADLGPGPARDVIAELLNGTHFNYVMVGSATNPAAVQSLVLTPKTAASETASAAPARPAIPSANAQAFAAGRRGIPEAAQDADDPAEDDSADATDVPDEPPQQDQQTPQQQTPKTPEQLLQELQRQQQQQQNAQPGQSPSGMIPNQPPTQAPNQQKPD